MNQLRATGSRIYGLSSIERRGMLDLIGTVHRGSDGDDFVFPPTEHARRRRPARSAEHAGEAANRPFPSAKPKLDRAKRRGGRGESIGWVSYRRNEAQELGHDAMRVDGEDPTTARNSPIAMATHAKLVVASAPRRPGDALGLVP